MLTFLGAGLHSIDDLTMAGVKALKQSDAIYLDMYTSIMPGFTEEVTKLTGLPVKLADRELVEESDEIVEESRDKNVIFVVVGDPLSATTHTDLLLRIIKAGIPYKMIHNTSIMTAVGCCGLQLYNFGVTVSIPFWDEFGSPESFYDKLFYNYSSGMHTLCLLDIKVKERSLDNILRDRKIYEPPRYMTCNRAAYQLLEIASRRQNTDSTDKCCLLSPDCLVIGLARVGAPTQSVVLSTLAEMGRNDESVDCSLKITTALGGPLHSLIIPGHIHPTEEEFLLSRYTRDSRPKEAIHDVFTQLPSIILPDGVDELDAMRLLFVNHNSLVSGANNQLNRPTLPYTSSFYQQHKRCPGGRFVNVEIGSTFSHWVSVI